jgi:hypothetical protein
VEKRVKRYLRSAWLSGWLGGVDIAVAVTTKVLSKLFSRASQVEGPWKMVPNLDRRNRSGRFAVQESKDDRRESEEGRSRTRKRHCFRCLPLCLQDSVYLFQLMESMTKY